METDVLLGLKAVKSQILTAIIATLMSIFATLAFTSGGSVNRAEVEKMILDSENRINGPVSELKQDQKEILKTVQEIKVDLAEVKARGAK